MKLTPRLAVLALSIFLIEGASAQRFTLQGLQNSAENLKKATKGSLKQEDQGTVDFLVNGSKSGAFKVGDGELAMQINLPKSFQYYDGFGYDKNEYKNGQPDIYVKIDGQPFKSWGRKLFDADYIEKKQFNIPIVPKSDMKINDTDMPEHNILLADESNSNGTQNTMMMLFLAQMYDKMALGNHTMEVEVWTGNY